MRLFRNWTKLVTVGGILIAFCILSFTFLLISTGSLDPNVDQEYLGMGMTIIPAKSITPTSTEQFRQLTATATEPLVGGIRLGMYVQILGTGGSGLRIRSLAGLNSAVNFIGFDDEVFYVDGGPVEEDGYIWWFLRAPYDESRNGWAAANFLSIVEQQP